MADCNVVAAREAAVAFLAQQRHPGRVQAGLQRLPIVRGGGIVNDDDLDLQAGIALQRQHRCHAIGRHRGGIPVQDADENGSDLGHGDGKKELTDAQCAHTQGQQAIEMGDFLRQWMTDQVQSQ